MCACGQLLHYKTPEREYMMCKIVRELGALIPFWIGAEEGYMVPRHYVALHGVKASELPELAKRYGWKRIK